VIWGFHGSGNFRLQSVVFSVDTSCGCQCFRGACSLCYKFCFKVGGSRFLQNLVNHLQAYMVSSSAFKSSSYMKETIFCMVYLCIKLFLLSKKRGCTPFDIITKVLENCCFKGNLCIKCKNSLLSTSYDADYVSGIWVPKLCGRKWIHLLVYKLMKITLHIVVVWFMTLCSLVGWYQHFRGT
jgi:hypothetical protein